MEERSSGRLAAFAVVRGKVCLQQACEGNAAESKAPVNTLGDGKSALVQNSTEDRDLCGSKH